jgi:hypothetical protein
MVFHKVGKHFGCNSFEKLMDSLKDYEENKEHACDVIEAFYYIFAQAEAKLRQYADLKETFHIFKKNFLRYYGVLKD